MTIFPDDFNIAGSVFRTLASADPCHWAGHDGTYGLNTVKTQNI